MVSSGQANAEALAWFVSGWIGVAVCLQQSKALPVVEFPVEKDGFDTEIEIFNQAKKLGKDIAGGVVVGETTHRQRVSLCSSRVRRGSRRRGT